MPLLMLSGVKLTCTSGLLLEFFMSETDEEKKKALEDLQVALRALSNKDTLPLRVKAMVLAALEKIEGKHDEPTRIS